VRWPLFRVAVAEQSMRPALNPGDWLIVARTRRVRAGQVVIARNPRDSTMLLVKRAARQLPDGSWWLESENKDVAAVDSRQFGPVRAADIAGRPLFRYRRGPRPQRG